MDWKTLRDEILAAKLSPAKAAQRVRQAVSRPVGRLDPMAVATELGATVHVVPKTTAFPMSGALIVRPETGNPPMILVNGAELDTRQRFSLAHELGHLFLHDLGVMYRDERLDGAAPVERQASAFAAELLMPFHEVESMAPTSPERVAARFGVSKQAAENRLRGMRWVP